MVFKQIEDSLTSSEFNGVISLFRKHTPIKHMVELQDNINTPYGTIKLDIEDTILLDTGILISEETITAQPTLKLVSPTFPHSNYHFTLDIIHYTGANIFDDNPNSYEVKDTITLDLPVNTTVQIPVENLQKGYIISLQAQLTITHDKTVIGGRPPQLTLTSDKTILSAYDGDTTVLTATYSQDEIPIPDTTVTFYNGATTLGTATTDNNGEAHLTYTATGIGDMSLTAKIGTLVSETYTIEDIYKYYSSVPKSDAIVNLTLPEHFELTFKLYSRNPTTDPSYAFMRFNSSSGPYMGKGSSGNGKVGINSTVLQTISSDVEYSYQLVYDGTTKMYIKDTSTSITVNTGALTKLYMFTSSTHTDLTDIKIKPL